MRNAIDVARRCVCLEMLHLRYELEAEDDGPLEDREQARAAWAKRDSDLGITEVLHADERAFLDRPVGSLSEDEVDDLHGRAAGALPLLWSLGRLEARPTFATVDTMESTLAEHGLLGDGSVAKARSAVESAVLRSETELDTGLAAYLRTRGRSKELDSADKIVAALAAHHITWILDDEMSFEEDLALT